MPVLLVFNELSAAMAANVADAKRYLEVFSDLVLDQQIKAARQTP